MKSKHFLILTLICAFVLAASNGFAQSSKTTSFEEWLEKYGAWDRLEQEYAKDQDKDSPEAILKRAEVYLNLNSPKQTLEIIEMTPSFEDNATEAQRLWLGGQAHRALGDLSKSVLWFSQAASSITNKSDRKRMFKAEPDLENMWMDVWLKLYWSYVANHTVSKESQLDALNRIREIGESVWGDSYWEKANAVINPSALPPAEKQTPPPAPELGPDGLPLPPFITNADTELIVKAMALISLEKLNDAMFVVSSIQQDAVRFFWISVLEFIQFGEQPSSLTTLTDGNYLKANAFWEGNLLAPYSASRSAWVLGNPDSVPWTKFRNNLLAMPVDEAGKAIDNELGSMLISEETAGLLNNLKLALSMANGDFINSANTWNKIEIKELPLALQLAGVLLFKEDFNKVLPEKPAQAFTVYPIFVALSGAAGHDLTESNEAPFWISAPQNKLKNLSQRDYPMDKLLLLAYWQQQFAKKQTMELAKRSAFLFNDTSFGIDSLLYLADQSVRAKKLQLGAFYLNRLSLDALNPTHAMAWLDVKTRLELDSGQIDTALKTFKQMTESDIEIPVMTRLRMALIYQQRRDFDAAREQLLVMWENRATMTTTLQAETLFWLGEGEQALRKSDKALNYYLHLAWQYPQENIWALTAMYRASLIYEKLGKYDTAKRLLKTVIKRADRKEQREAAKARIAAIDKKMGKQKSSKKNSVLVYPF